MLPLLIAIALCYLAYRTKPVEQSFRTFLEGSLESSASHGTVIATTTKLVPSFLRKFADRVAHGGDGRSAVVGRRLNGVRYTDYGFFVTCFLPSSGELYLGIFAQWLPISAFTDAAASAARQLEGGGTSVRNAPTDPSHLAEHERDLAIQAKSRKDYPTAARLFTAASSTFRSAAMASGETSSATFAHIESAQCLEEAAKMWRMDGHNVDRANGALKEAADRYRCYDRGVGRAARTYLMLGEKLMVGLAGDKDARNSVQQRRDALEALRTAAELFEVEHDSRSISAWVKVAELESTLAALARHSSSSSSSSSSSTATTFDTAIYTWMRCVHATSNDSAFAFQAGTYLANVGWCTLAIGDDVRMDRWIESTISEHLAFAETREFRLLQQLATAVRDHDTGAWDVALTAYTKLSAITDPWKVQVVQDLRAAMAEAEVSLM